MTEIDGELLAETINALFQIEQQAEHAGHSPIQAKAEAARKELEAEIPDLQTHE